MTARGTLMSAVVICAVLATAAAAHATTVTLGPSALTLAPGAYYCDGPGCESRSFVHVAGPAGAFLTTGRGKVVRWRVAATADPGGSLRLWVVRPGVGSTRAVAGPSVAADLNGA